MNELFVTAQPRVDAALCTRCGLCVKNCPTEALALGEKGVRFAPTSFMQCIGCGHCMAICPSRAIAVEGRRMSPASIHDFPAAGAAAAETLDALFLRRRSVRRFGPQEVERAAVDRILAMAATAPMGIPPSEVGILVFHGREKVRRFAAEAVEIFRGMQKSFSPLRLQLLRPFIGRAQYIAMRDLIVPVFAEIAAEWEAGRDVFAYEAPLAFLFHCGANSDPADAHIATTYAMLAAHSLGLGTCMLGTTIVLDRAPQWKAKHGIPKKNKIGLALIAGHPTVQFQRGIRHQFAEVKWE